MNPSLSKDGKPVLDETTFQKLLEAAYVVQEHSDRGAPSSSGEAGSEPTGAASDSTTTLAEIVETQHQIHTGHLDLDSCSNLVAERLRKITGAQGTAIGILDDEEKLVYRAGSGILASQVGTALRPEATLSASTLLHDAILRCPDAATDFRVNPEIAKRLGAQSLISVPVFHDGKIAGALELVFAKPNAFQEQDVRTSQLMAGLITEALTHAAEEEWRKGVTAERASMLEVLERIKPQLARLAQEPQSSPPLDPTLVEPTETTQEDSKCHHCGNELAPGEVFCGSCGTSRAETPHNDLQSKWATLWNLKKASDPMLANPAAESEPVEAIEPTDSATSPNAAGADFALPDFILPEKKSSSHAPAPSELSDTIEAHDQPSLPPVSQEPAAVHPPETLVEPAPVPFKKPVESRVWLDSITVSPPAVQLKGFWQKNKTFVRKHPGDLALVAAVILFVITIIWAIAANNPTTSADSGNSQAAVNGGAPVKPKKKQPPPSPKLTMFEQLLISIGLAEPPPAPSYNGNPNVPVWVDVHTALYHCPGSELYGKTPQGRIASQHDAQMDQFEPASRKVCD